MYFLDNERIIFEWKYISILCTDLSDSWQDINNIKSYLQSYLQIDSSDSHFRFILLLKLDRAIIVLAKLPETNNEWIVVRVQLQS